MALFSGDEAKKKASLRKYLEDKIENAGREFAKSNRPVFNILFWRQKPKPDPLCLHQTIVKGFDYALRAAIIKGAPATTVVYETAANMVIDRVQSCVKKNMSSIQSTDSSGNAFLSFKIVQSDTIGRSFKENINRMRHEVQAAIFATSEYIQMQEFASLNEVLDSKVDSAKKQQISTFVNGHYRLHVSYQAMGIALQLFSLVNQELLERINQSRNRAGDEFDKLAVTNAVLVYEVADVIIAFLRAFELQGVKEIRDIHNQVTREIKRGRVENHAILDRIDHREKSSGLSFLNLALEREAVHERLNALEQLEKEWSGLIKKIDDVQKGAYKFADCVDDLEILKSNAAANLTILGLMEITRMVKTNIETIQGVLRVDRLQITPITADDVRRFLRVQIDRE